MAGSVVIMTDNFGELETGQLEIMHQQVHDRLSESDNCNGLRMQHDSLAAELVKRGMAHDTEIACPEIETDAPNYRRGFTDDICTNCAFGQLYPYCNLYKFDYTKDYVCDSFRYYEVMELETPHGYLMAQEKKIAIARIEPLDTEKSYLIVSGGEAFGIATFEPQPAQVKTKEFDSSQYQEQHRVNQRERRQWWPDSEVFYVYRLKEWLPYEGVKLYDNGKVIDEPKLTFKQRQLVSRARDLPRQIMLIDNAVSITDQKTFLFDKSIDAQKVESVLRATYGLDHVVKEKIINEAIPLYSLALVRNPRMRVVKKSEKQEDGEVMPYEIEEREGEYCVIKTEDGESAGCHETREEAERQLTALRINVESEEGESAVHSDKPEKRKPKKKKEMFGTEESIEQQLNFIRRQFEDQFNSSATNKVEPVENYAWVNDIFDSFIIADEEGRLFRVDYMLFEDEVLFAPRERWIEVERGYRPKGFKLLKSGLKQYNNVPEMAKKTGFVESLKSVAKSIGDFLKYAETEENEVKLFTNKVGIAQKEVGGELWHFTWSTNAFEDREKEMFSTNSLKQYVERAKETDKGYFNFWHIKGTDFARKEWQMVIGRFLVEAGPYLNNKAGQAAKEFFKQYSSGHPEIAPEGWGCSPEFRYLPEERATGTYETIWITRTSTLPKMAAANIWTETSQLTRSKMAITDYSEDQIKAAVEIFKDENFVKSLIAEGENKTAELEAAGIAHKEKSEETEQSEPQQLNINMEELAAEVGKQFSANLNPIADALSTMATELKELKEWKASQEKKAEVKAVTETPRYILNLQRASENESTIVTEDDGLKDRKPSETKGNASDPWSQIFNK